MRKELNEDEEVNDLARQMRDLAVDMGADGKTYTCSLCVCLATQLFAACGKDIAKQDERIDQYVTYIKTALAFNGARDEEGTGRDKENQSLQ